MYFGDGTDETGRWIDKAEKPKQVGLTVRGFESPTVQEELRLLQKKAAKSKKDGDEADIDDDTERGLKLVCSLVTAFHGIYRDGEALKATEDDKRFFFGQSDDLVGQVTAFARERVNFYKAE